MPGTAHTPVSGSQKRGFVVLVMSVVGCAQPVKVSEERARALRALRGMIQALSTFTEVIVNEPATGLSLKSVARSSFPCSASA